MKPTWVRDTAKEFTSYSTMGEDGHAWIKASRTWLRRFCKKNNFGLVFHPNHYEWSAFIKTGSGWWYLNSGDVRFNIMNSLLVRTARDTKDFTGGINRWVSYDSQDFEGDLLRLVSK